MKLGHCHKGVTVSNYQLGLPPADSEPDNYAIVKLPLDWWGLMNVRTDAVVVKIHGPGAREDIVNRWNVKAAVWMAWRERQNNGEKKES